MPILKRDMRLFEEAGDAGGNGGGAGGGTDNGGGGNGTGAGGDGTGGPGDGSPGGGGSIAGGGTGGGGADWRHDLPAELRDDPTIQNTPDVTAAAKSLVEAQKLIGSSLRVPGETADQEQWDKFYERLRDVPGVARIPGPEASEEERKGFFGKLAPASPEEYEFSFTGTDEQGNPKGVQDQELVKEYATKAHELGLTPQQADQMGVWMAERAKANMDAKQEAFDKGMESLRKEYGEDGLQQRMTLAKAVIQKFAGETDTIPLAEAMQSNPALIGILSNIGEQMGEAIDAGVHRDRSDVGQWTKTEIERRIGEIRVDPAFNDAESPRHKPLMQEFERLGEALYRRENAA